MSEDDTWTTRDGQTIPIQSMTTRHIENVIKYLARRLKEAESMIFNAILPDDALDMAFLRIDEIDGVIDAMEEELRRRIQI